MAKDLNKKVIIYSSIAFFITWTIAFGIYGLFRNETIDESQLNLFHSLAAIGPTMAAIITTHSFYGKQGMLDLLSKLKFPLPKNRTTFLIISPLVFFIIGLFIFKIVTSNSYDFGAFVKLNWGTNSAFIIWLLPLLTYAIFEEIGWRGFLLPHLQSHYTAWKSTIILTAIWALWHLPFFFYRFDFSLGISIGFFFGIFVGSIILTSIYNSSNGFLLPVMTFHFLNNICSAFDKKIIVAVLSVGFVFIAIYIYNKFGKTNLSNIGRQRNYFNNEEKITA